MGQISIHSTRVGGDGTLELGAGPIEQFQSTPPVWAETAFTFVDQYIAIISIHSTRVGGDKRCENSTKLD